MADHVDGDGIAVCVKRDTAAHAHGDADVFVGDALVADQSEAVVNHLLRHVYKAFASGRHLGGVELLAHPQFGGEEGENTFRGDDHRRIDLAVVAKGLDPDNLAVLQDEVFDGAAVDEGRARLDRLLGKPVVPLGTEDGIAVIGGLIEVFPLHCDVDMRVLGHEDGRLLADMPLQRGLVPVFVKMLFQGRHLVEHAAEHVLFAGEVPSLQKGDVNAPLGHFQGRGGACGAGAYYYGFK